MFYRQESDQYINEGASFTIDGVTYPSNWLNQATPAQKQTLGLVEVVATNNPFDPKYYWTGETLDGASLTYTGTAKELEQVKQGAISDLNQTAYTLLFPTDWMYVRLQEASTPIPADVLTYRSDVRSVTASIKAAVNGCQSVDDVANVMATIVWPSDPNTVSIEE
jgi:hypothetical protein